MAANITTTQAQCKSPCGTESCGQLVEVKVNARKGTMTYAPCDKLIAQGWTSKVGSVHWTPATEVVGYQHRDGLVVIR